MKQMKVFYNITMISFLLMLHLQCFDRRIYTRNMYINVSSFDLPYMYIAIKRLMISLLPSCQYNYSKFCTCQRCFVNIVIVIVILCIIINLLMHSIYILQFILLWKC